MVSNTNSEGRKLFPRPDEIFGDLHRQYEKDKEKSPFNLWMKEVLKGESQPLSSPIIVLPSTSLRKTKDFREKGGRLEEDSGIAGGYANSFVEQETGMVESGVSDTPNGNEMTQEKSNPPGHTEIVLQQTEIDRLGRVVEMVYATKEMDAPCDYYALLGIRRDELTTLAEENPEAASQRVREAYENISRLIPQDLKGADQTLLRPIDSNPQQSILIRQQLELAVRTLEDETSRQRYHERIQKHGLIPRASVAGQTETSRTVQDSRITDIQQRISICEALLGMVQSLEQRCDNALSGVGPSENIDELLELVSMRASTFDAWRTTLQNWETILSNLSQEFPTDSRIAEFSLARERLMGAVNSAYQSLQESERLLRERSGSGEQIALPPQELNIGESCVITKDQIRFLQGQNFPGVVLGRPNFANERPINKIDLSSEFQVTATVSRENVVITVNSSGNFELQISKEVPYPVIYDRNAIHVYKKESSENSSKEIFAGASEHTLLLGQNAIGTVSGAIFSLLVEDEQLTLTRKHDDPALNIEVGQIQSVTTAPKVREEERTGPLSSKEARIFEENEGAITELQMRITAFWDKRGGKEQANTLDHYRKLGLVAPSNDEEIKKAYRKLEKQFHPDATVGDDDLKKCRQTALIEQRVEVRGYIAEAYDVLSDQEKKANYDANPSANGLVHNENHIDKKEIQGIWRLIFQARDLSIKMRLDSVSERIKTGVGSTSFIDEVLRVERKVMTAEEGIALSNQLLWAQNNIRAVESQGIQETDEVKQYHSCLLILVKEIAEALEFEEPSRKTELLNKLKREALIQDLKGVNQYAKLVECLDKVPLLLVQHANGTAITIQQVRSQITHIWQNVELGALMNTTSPIKAGVTALGPGGLLASTMYESRINGAKAMLGRGYLNSGGGDTIPTRLIPKDAGIRETFAQVLSNADFLAAYIELVARGTADQALKGKLGFQDMGLKKNDIERNLKRIGDHLKVRVTVEDKEEELTCSQVLERITELSRQTNGAKKLQKLFQEVSVFLPGLANAYYG